MNTNLPINLRHLISGKAALPHQSRPVGPIPARPRLSVMNLLIRLLAAAGALMLILFLAVCARTAVIRGVEGLLRTAFLPVLPGGFAPYITAPADLPVQSEVPTPSEQEAESPLTDSQPEVKDVYAFDASAVPEGDHPIIPTDLSTVFAEAEPYLSNATKYMPDLAALAAAEYPLAPASALAPAGAPLVLILHTHGTEGYSEESSVSYSESYNLPRSNDITQNVVAVGAVMTEQLLVRGISTLHCTIMHDAESYRDSYSRAAETIRSYLEEYPSIQYVFDVHRDSIVRESGEKLRPVFAYNGEPVAQVMSVVGSDELGADFPDWEKNLTLALKLHASLEKKYGAMSRPINLRSAAFNEHYAQAALLLEVGSCGNTLSEAKRAGALLADTLADLILTGNGEAQ